MTIYVVSNVAQLNAALIKADGDDRIELTSGNYGDLKLRDLKFGAEVVITAHDSGAPPHFNSISLTNSSHVSFDGLKFDFVPTASTVEWSAAIRIDGSSNIDVRNSTITGGNAVAGIDPTAAAGTQGAQGIKGLPIGVGISVYNGKAIDITNNDISKFSAGIRFSNVDGIDMTGNEISNVRKVPVGGGNVSNVVMSDNSLHDVSPWKFGGLGDHGDFVHFWTTPEQTTPSANFTFINNSFQQGDGTPVLGIYLDDNTNNKGFANVLIEGNVIHNGNAQGLRMEDVNGLTVRNNTFLQSSGDAPDAPMIYLAEGTRNVVIDRNILSGVVGPAMQNLQGNNIAIVDNVVVQTQDPLAVNYVGMLFTNALTAHPALTDLRAIPGSMADGYGAASSQVNDATRGFDGIISESRGTGLALSTHHFDLLDGAMGDGSAITANANVQWDFGDGTRAMGAQIGHTYGSAGIYQAKATVTLASGQVHVIQKTIDVSTPVAVLASFDKGLKDESDIIQAVQAIGAVSLVQSDFGQSVKLTGAKSAVKFAANAEILDNKEFTISLAFKKSIGAEATGGRVLYFSGTAVIDVAADGITLRGTTDDGEAVLLRSTASVGIRDHDWHQITYTASQTNGTAILYVDGTEVARMEGLTGAQQTTAGHSLYLGNPFGANMNGLLDNMSFLQAALTREQVQNSFAQFEKGELANFRPVAATTGAGLAAMSTVADRVAEAVVVAAPVDSLHKDGWTGFKLDPNALSTKLMDDAAVVQTAHGKGIHFDGDGDYVALGRMTALEASDRVAFSIDFAQAAANQDPARLVWNTSKLGLTLQGDGLLVQVATATQGFKSFTIRDLGLNDTDLHRVIVMLDAETDHLQVLLDNKLVFDEQNTDFEIVGAGGRESGWMIGTPWNRPFEGDVTEFRLGDRFDFMGGGVHGVEFIG